jgi:hypothetical protein
MQERPFKLIRVELVKEVDVQGNDTTVRVIWIVLV